MRNMWIERGMVARRYILIRVRAKSNIMETRSVQTEEPEGKTTGSTLGKIAFLFSSLGGLWGYSLLGRTTEGWREREREFVVFVVVGAC